MKKSIKALAVAMALSFGMASVAAVSADELYVPAKAQFETLKKELANLGVNSLLFANDAATYNDYVNQFCKNVQTAADAKEALLNAQKDLKELLETTVKKYDIDGTSYYATAKDYNAYVNYHNALLKLEGIQTSYDEAMEAMYGKNGSETAPVAGSLLKNLNDAKAAASGKAPGSPEANKLAEAQKAYDAGKAKLDAANAEMNAVVEGQIPEVTFAKFVSNVQTQAKDALAKLSTKTYEQQKEDAVKAVQDAKLKATLAARMVKAQAAAFVAAKLPAPSCYVELGDSTETAAKATTKKDTVPSTAAYKVTFGSEVPQICEVKIAVMPIKKTEEAKPCYCSTFNGWWNTELTFMIAG